MPYFKEITTIPFEGRYSKTPLAFKYYDSEQLVAGKPMKEHLRFAMSYWHTLTGEGSDMFGSGTFERPWNALSGLELSKARATAAFELMQKLDIPYFCFHDLDVAPEGSSLKEKFENLDVIVAHIQGLMKQTGIKLLWGTTNAFSHPRFVHGASTSCNSDVFAFTAAQVKKAMDVTMQLGGENYVFWGGREGYDTLLNTDMALEMDNYARFLKMAVDYKQKIGFTGQLLIEPKPKEPTKHQYDFDAATVLAFLRKYGLENDFKMNIEANHATLAGHTFEHELQMSRINGVLGSIDANQGDDHLGWDTDQFPTNIYSTTYCMMEVLKNGGIAPGGLNFDAKLRRGSLEAEDLFAGYIAGMDAFAKGLIVAEKLISEGELEAFVSERYKSYSIGIGQDILKGRVGFDELSAYAMTHDRISNKSSKQEWLESIVNDAIFNA